MKFKEWLKINEARASVRQRPSSASRPTLNQGFLRGSAATWGHGDSPLPPEKAITAAASAIGSGIRKTLEDEIGLVVQGVGRIMSPEIFGKSGELIKYYSLPFQIPKSKHNSSYENYNQGIDSGSPNTPKVLYKNIKNISPNLIRHYEEPMDVEVNGKFLLLNSEEDASGKTRWNWNPQESRQFTRALIYKCIVDDMNSNKKEAYEYDVNRFSVVEEKDEDLILTTWFAFEKLKSKGAS
jgi:hypothetical protein